MCFVNDEVFIRDGGGPVALPGEVSSRFWWGNSDGSEGVGDGKFGESGKRLDIGFYAFSGGQFWAECLTFLAHPKSARKRLYPVGEGIGKEHVRGG